MELIDYINFWLLCVLCLPAVVGQKLQSSMGESCNSKVGDGTEKNPRIFFTSELSWLKGKYCFEVTARISALSYFKLVAEQLTPASGSV